MTDSRCKHISVPNPGRAPRVGVQTRIPSAASSCAQAERRFSRLTAFGMDGDDASGRKLPAEGDS
jgi:hypothetical protein